ncbi:hypothetical protein IV498_06925, partial [Paenarthrobacter sp. Z7-10]|uniref:hypothetical protein n=1 Tax=Paenarthrobacter sp. Z7-10 TaxID=2787635 RepID=UPI0022A90913
AAMTGLDRKAVSDDAVSVDEGAAIAGVPARARAPMATIGAINNRDFLDIIILRINVGTPKPGRSSLIRREPDHGRAVHAKDSCEVAPTAGLLLRTHLRHSRSGTWPRHKIVSEVRTVDRYHRECRAEVARRR